MSASWWQKKVESPWLRVVVGRRPAMTLLRLALLLGLYFGLFRPAFLATRVLGNSMEPTYVDGRANLVFRWAYRRGAPGRGDVVVLRKSGTLQRILKRIVGLPGESVAIRRGRVFIDGTALDEPYARGARIMHPEVHLGPDEYFAVGDNREVSEAGKVLRAEILGKVVY